jgi:peptide deformylase
MLHPFISPSDPRLAQSLPQIPLEKLKSQAVQGAIDAMLEVARPAQTDRSRAVMVGLAACQIGLPYRIAMVDVLADGHGAVGDLRIYLNPVLTIVDPTPTTWYEGCYSTATICGIIQRAQTIRVKALTRSGEPIDETHSGYIARIFQHEVDHLDGVTLIDRSGDPSRLHMVESSDFPHYRDEEGWRRWTRLAPVTQQQTLTK